MILLRPDSRHGGHASPFCCCVVGSMDDAAAARQIQMMTRFIELEAKERAEEIATEGEEAYAIEYANLLEKETQAIQEDFTKRQDAIDVARKM